MSSFISGKEASKLIGCHQQTLHRYAEQKIIECIRTPGGYRKYNIQKFLSERNITNDTPNEKKKICYCRVSTRKQKTDLEYQKKISINKISKSWVYLWLRKWFKLQ